jgi:hypothetical protein
MSKDSCDRRFKKRGVRKALSTNSGRNTDATSLSLGDILERIAKDVNIFAKTLKKVNHLQNLKTMILLISEMLTGCPGRLLTQHLLFFALTA